MSLYQTESLCTEKETINKPKASILNGERYLQSDTSDKGFISKVDKEFKQFSIKKKKATWAEDLNRCFPKEKCRWPTDT